MADRIKPEASQPGQKERIHSVHAICTCGWQVSGPQDSNVYGRAFAHELTHKKLLNPEMKLFNR